MLNDPTYDDGNHDEQSMPAVTPMQYAGGGTVAVILATAFSSNDRWVQITGLIAAAIVAVGLTVHEAKLRVARLDHIAQIAHIDAVAPVEVEHVQPTPTDHDPFTDPHPLADL